LAGWETDAIDESKTKDAPEGTTTETIGEISVSNLSPKHNADENPEPAEGRDDALSVQTTDLMGTIPISSKQIRSHHLIETICTSTSPQTRTLTIKYLQTE
jgi:hypothetical protein